MAFWADFGKRCCHMSNKTACAKDLGQKPGKDNVICPKLVNKLYLGV